MTYRQWTDESIVVPAVGAASSISCLRSLGRRGIHTIAVSERGSAPGFRSRYCDEAIVVPSPAEDLIGYRDALLSLARRDDVRAIAPIREADVYVLSAYYEEFAEHIAPVWPSFETLRDAHDRIRLVEAATEAGVSVPETRLLSETEDWDRELIVKGRYAAHADGYVESLSPADFVDSGPTRYLEPGIEPDRDAIRAEMGHDPIVQEYVPGAEFAFWALYDHGEAVATCQRNRIRGFKYSGSASIYRESVRIPELEAAGRALLDALDWHGLAAVQFMRDANTGEFRLMEINPRFWLSLPCAVQAGADFPYYYWRLAGGESIRIDAAYEVGVGTHLLRGEATHLHSILREDYAFVPRPSFSATFREVVRSIYEQPNFDLLSLDDPGPFVRDALNTAASLR